MTGIFEGLFPDFHSRRKTLVITHADIDQTASSADMFDRGVQRVGELLRELPRWRGRESRISGSRMCFTRRIAC